MRTTTRIEDRAAEWLAREDRSFTEDDRVGLERWLAESSAHRVAYLRLKAAWVRADRLVALRSPNPDASSDRMEVADVAAPIAKRAVLANSIRLKVAGAAAVIAVALVALVLTVDGIGTPEDYRTQVGGREVVPLADGSRLELNTDTQLRARVTGQARTVWLDRGEAYFDVAHDRDRPFVVIAGPRRITVLGTKFSVRREADDLQIKVVEGRVKLESPGGTAIPGGPAALAPAVLVRSQVAIAKEDSTLVAERAPEEIADDLAWRHGMLVMNQWTLADAAREFNRYNHKKLIIDPAVAGMRLGGTFESGNVEVFSRLLKEGFGLHVEGDADRIVVSN